MTSYEEHITDSANVGPTLVRWLHADNVASSLQPHNTTRSRVSYHIKDSLSSKHTATT